LTISTEFTGNFLKTLIELSKKPKLLRPFYAWMLGSKKVVRTYKKEADILLTPTIQARLEEERLAEKNGAAHKKPNDLLQWLTDLVEPQHKNTESLSELQLLVVFASILTTSNSLFNMLLDLAAHQECIQPIREEIESAISSSNGAIDKSALQKMKKTDSFFKESTRMTTNLSKHITTFSLKACSYSFVQSVSTAKL